MEIGKNISYFKGNKETTVDEKFIKNEMVQLVSFSLKLVST